MSRISLLLVVFVFNSILVFGQDKGFEPIERDTTFKPHVTYNEESGNYILSYMRDAETGKVYETLYVPPTKITPILNVSIEKQSNNFNYNYELINSDGSEQDISSLELEIKNQFENIIFPANWYFRNNRVLPYIRVTHKFLSVPEYDEDKPIKFESDLQVGEKLEFIVKSINPPTIITSYVSGQPQKISFQFVLPPNLEVRKLRDSLITKVANDRGIELKTIGPRTLPSPFNHLNFLDSLRNYIPQARDLDWLGDTPFATQLENQLQQARTELVAGDSAIAAATLADFIQVVEEVNAGNGPAGASLTPEGYGLLYFNAQYLLDRLPEPQAGEE